MSKLPSALIKPESQCAESSKSLTLISGLFTGIHWGNSDFITSDKPRFIEALMLMILLKPSLVR
jgi:hypothetical protein